MKYSAVIFDLDGVLCHTDQYHYISWKKIADELGIYFDEELNNRLRGVGRLQSLDIILEKSDKIYSDDEKKFYACKKNAIYVDLLNDLTANNLDEDVMTILKELRNRGLKLAIGSSSKNAKLILQKTGLEEFFDAVSDGTNICKTKPNPEVFLKASEYINVPPKDCIVVEDAISGVLAALAAGMDCAAIGDASDFKEATYHLGKLSDLLIHMI